MISHTLLLNGLPLH